MTIIRRAIHLAVFMCAVAGCRKAPPPGGKSGRDTSRLIAADSAYYLNPKEGCGYVAQDLNPDPIALVREYNRRDNLGEFLQTNAWLDSAYACPGHLPGPDMFTVVSSTTITGQQLTDSGARVFVQSVVLGEMGQDSVGPVFERRPTIKVDTFVVDHTPYGWRIREPQLPDNVGAAWVLAHPERIRLRSTNRDSLVSASRSVTPNER